MKVVLDARPLSHPQAGGFRSYVRALLQGFSERGTDDFTLILYIDRELTPADRVALPPGARVRVLMPDRLKTDLLWFPQAVREDKPDLVHGTMNYLPNLGGTKKTLTIHDAIGIVKYPWDDATPRTPRERFVNRYWAWMTRHSAVTARQIITDSRGAAEDLAKALPVPEERITVVCPGVMDIALPASKEIGQPLENSVLAIASPDPRKNIELIYRAVTEETRQFARSVPPRLHLVCSSDISARRAEEAVARYGIQNARLLRNLDDDALRNEYGSAGVFAWPSLREGFGLPPLEAMQSGCSVAASDAPVMPEVLGDTPVYFDPKEPAELAGALACLLSEPPRARQERLRAGRDRSGQFTCLRMAEEVVSVWKAAGDGRQ